MGLERFRRAQDGVWSGYQTALEEIRSGRKTSHWIWYIFPQIAGLGRSSTAQQYALVDLAEACAYLQDATLRARYEEMAAEVSSQLNKGVRVEVLMGGSIDALKLASSLTLFRAAASRLAEQDSGFEALAQRCDGLLRQMAPQGYAACSLTLEKLH